MITMGHEKVVSEKGSDTLWKDGTVVDRPVYRPQVVLPIRANR